MQQFVNCSSGESNACQIRKDSGNISVSFVKVWDFSLLNKPLSQPVTILWMLAEDTRLLGQRQRTYYSQQSRQHELYICVSSFGLSREQHGGGQMHTVEFCHSQVIVSNERTIIFYYRMKLRKSREMLQLNIVRSKYSICELHLLISLTLSSIKSSIMQKSRQ